MKGQPAAPARDFTIDFLRFIGLSLIILAHVNPPAFLFQLRNFDVPLMVMVSGMAYGLSDKGEPYAAYVWKRIQRLFFPTFIFLTFYFAAMAALHRLGIVARVFDARTIATSYLLLSGIGYVWIIRVFLLVALAAPGIRHMSQKMKAPDFFCALLICYIGYEAVLALARPYLQTAVGKSVEDIIFYLAPYGILFAFGMRARELSRKALGVAAVLFLILFALLAVYERHLAGHVVSTQNFKYPPTAYYLSYALAASLAMLLAAPRAARILSAGRGRALVEFTSANSIWVYLWHIAVLDVVQAGYILKYFLVYGAALVITFCQVRFVSAFVLPKIPSREAQKNICSIFTG